MDERLGRRVARVDGDTMTRVGRVGARDLEPDGALGAADQHSFAVAQVVKPLEEVNSP